MRNNKWLSLIVLGAMVLAAVGSSPVQADPGVLYVKPDGNGECSSWDDACTLQDALDRAVVGDEVWVAEGTHTPTVPTDPGDPRTATFQLASGVAIYGGFAGTEVEREQRDPVAHETVLSGDIGVAGDSSDNAYHVVTGSGTDATAVLDGFTITGGAAEGEYWDRCGGGMLNEGGSPTLSNLAFSGNLALGHGGGMFNLQSSPALTHVTFSDNVGEGTGGGMANGDGSNPTLTYVSFTGNLTYGSGGGMANNQSHPTLLRVSFSGNSAENPYRLTGGGGMSNIESNPVVTYVTFSDNSADVGCGMYNHESSPTVTHTIFQANLDGDGAGMYNDWFSLPTLTNVIFRGNSGFLGGGMYNEGHSDAILRNVVFSGNHADAWGGGMMNSESSPSLTNITFSGNSAGSGGGILNSPPSAATLTNCILWGNTATSEGSQIHNLAPCTLTMAYCNIQDSGGSGSGWDSVLGADGGGNIDADPFFVDASLGDLHLQASSPSIDAGDNGAVPPEVTTDLDGNPRIVNDTVDMGAYEHQAAAGIEASIDIKPSSPANRLNLDSKGMVRVAILTTVDLNATSVKPGMVLFAETPASRWEEKDVDSDGNMDLLLSFPIQDLNLDSASTQATLTGSTYDDQAFSGTDFVSIVD